ncbi:peptidyl-prolyl cis-trans isomerase [Paenibacillus sp. NEAU-GSW1]|uniref:foldase protein PrsA n=1 Tax=Paenibacillus sp. NEAU-GSW1 TaxID=2682486 RepID=UPI0012E0D0F8|nr:peptidyl-prolyl cis-trans isomerase [Paenibacillus sp. NEAU-GSW1]MUT66068.1 peptidylprolyl isomerase [Paenibacillus sp. NEAU-GSW1]
MENKDSQQPREEELKKAAADEQLEQAEEQFEYDNDADALSDDAEDKQAAVEESEPAAAPAEARKSGSKAWIAISAILAIALVITLIFPPFGGNAGKTVASVNGKKISQNELYNEMLPQSGASTLDTLITKELIDQAADKAGISVSEKDVDAEIEKLVTQFGSQEALDSAVTQAGMTMESLRDNTFMQLKIRKILEPKTTVKDEDVQKYFDENKASFATPEQIRVSHIYLATKEEAEAVLKQLNEGGDFAKLAAEKSTDTNSSPNGGDLGFIGKGDIGDEAFDTAAFALKIGEMSGVVQSASGFHIIKKTEEKAATTPTFEEKKEDIRTQLIDEQISELSVTWMEELRSSAKITNKLEEETASDSAATEAPAQ